MRRGRQFKQPTLPASAGSDPATLRNSTYEELVEVVVAEAIKHCSPLVNLRGLSLRAKRKIEEVVGLEFSKTNHVTWDNPNDDIHMDNITAMVHELVDQLAECRISEDPILNLCGQ